MMQVLETFCGVLFELSQDSNETDSKWKYLKSTPANTSKVPPQNTHNGKEMPSEKSIDLGQFWIEQADSLRDLHVITIGLQF